MGATKKRINLTIDSETYKYLKKLSSKQGQRVSALSLQMIRQGLEREEDEYFSKIAEKRLSQKRISHRKAWT